MHPSRPCPERPYGPPARTVLVALLLALGLAGPGTAQVGGGGAQDATDLDDLRAFLEEAAGEVEGQAGQWTAEIGGTQVLLVADPEYGRMRLMSPVDLASETDGSLLRRLMEANFSSSMDARYAIWQDRVWALYTHSLPDLERRRFHDALGQVVNLARTYGGSFSAADTRFGGEVDPPRP